MIFAGVIGGAPPATLIGTTEDTATRLGSYTFAGVDFGPDYSGRTIFVVANLWQGGQVQLDQSSATIGGQAATGDDSGEFGDSPPDGTAGVGIWAAQPSGNSGTVVVNFGPSSAQGCSISVVSVPNLSSITAHATYKVAGSGSGRASQSGTINIPTNGFLIMGLTRALSTSAVTFTGATEAVDAVFDTSSRKGVAFDEGLSLQANRPIGWSSTGVMVSGYIARSYA